MITRYNPLLDMYPVCGETLRRLLAEERDMSNTTKVGKCFNCKTERILDEQGFCLECREAATDSLIETGAE